MSDSVLGDLKAQIAARRVVVVVGSGTTIAATKNAQAASWTGLLKLGVQRCVELDPALAGDWEKRALGDVTSGHLDDLLAAATKVTRALRRKGEWARWLSDTIGRLGIVAPEVFDAIGTLDAPILTTNYDDLIDRRLNRLPITTRNRVEQISFARLESRDTVLHLHGHWRDPETVVLDTGDYERIVGNGLAQAGLRTMGEAWSFLFVGCGEGLADPNFEQFLDWMGDILEGSRHRHFRLERASEVSRRQAWHDDRGHRVRVIAFGEEHGDLPSFVARLRTPASCSRENTAAASNDEPAHRAARLAVPAGEYVHLQERGRTAVQSLITVSEQLGFKSIAAHGTTLHQALEEDLYRVAITGRSRAGKSTLINALVRRVICPVDRVITTAIPIIIGPGEIESARISFQGEIRAAIQVDGPVTSDMLAPYAVQQHNPGNAKHVDRIEVRLGHDVLDLGVEYIDIPGFDDPSGKIWASARDIIHAAHALVLVVDISTFESGGFALDKATRELLESAHHRGCPVLIVCNKADRLSSSDKEDAARYLNEQLERFGVVAALTRPPFFLSARDALGACIETKAVPGAMDAFENALWEQLWKTEAVGLRRLHRVFDALRVADEEVAALMQARLAKGAEREELREAIRACRDDLSRIRANSATAISDLRTRAAKAVERARGDYRELVKEYSASAAGAQMPPVSVAVAALRDRFTAQCESVLNEVEGAVRARLRAVDGMVTRSLARLRERAGAGVGSRGAREVLDSLSQAIGEVSVPGLEDSERMLKKAGAGFGTAAAIGFTLGGPAGWFIGAVAGLLMSACVGQAADSVDTREKLEARVAQQADEAFTAFASRLDAVVADVAARLDARVVGRMQPFLADMEEKLEEIREPTPDEVALQHEVRRITRSALDSLVPRFGGGSR